MAPSCIARDGRIPGESTPCHVLGAACVPVLATCRFVYTWSGCRILSDSGPAMRPATKQSQTLLMNRLAATCLLPYTVLVFVRLRLVLPTHHYPCKELHVCALFLMIALCDSVAACTQQLSHPSMWCRGLPPPWQTSVHQVPPLPQPQCRLLSNLGYPLKMSAQMHLGSRTSMRTGGW
jgi:hypothetical protein